MTAMLVRCEPTSAAVVRREIAHDLAQRGIDESARYEVLLVASELVGNAVRHAGRPDEQLEVTWTTDPRSVTVAVADSSHDVPQPRDAGDEDTDGRGLAIIAAVAMNWGVEQTPQGKRVWARVPIRSTDVREMA